MTGTQTQLVARDDAVASIGAALASVQRGRPAVIHVVAEAGLGKTRLLAEATNLARDHGLAVVSGTAHEGDGGRPFGVVSDPIAEHISVLSDRRRDALAGGTDQLGKAIRAGLGARGVESMLRSTIAGLAGVHPLLLAYDDVHWADEGSMDVLAGLSSRPPHGSMVLVLAYRPSRSVGALEALGPGHVERIRLRPLHEDEVAQLLPDVGPIRRRELFEVCRGNPFFLQSLQSLEGPLRPDVGGVGVLPAPVRHALTHELGALGAAHRPALDLAAVVGDPFDASLLGAAGDLTQDETAAAIDEMRALDLVAPVAAGRWRFRHPLLRRVAYEELTTGERTRLHRQAADILALRRATIAERARHLLMCALPGDRDAAELLISAADDLSAQAPAQAAAWFAAALHLVPDGGERGVDFVRLALAQCQVAVGGLVEARSLVHEVLASLTADDPRRPLATAVAARIEHLMGRGAESEALLLRELDRAVERPPAAVSSLRLELATSWLMDGEFAAARSAADEALVGLGEDDGLLSSLANATIALCAAVGGDVSSALAIADRAARAVDGLSDAELALSLEAGVWLGWAEMFLERLPDAERHLTRCLSIARRGAHQHVLPHLLVGYGSVLKTVGALQAAADAYDEAAEAASRLPGVESRAMTRTMQCRAATWLGDLELAQRYGDDAVQLTVGPARWFASVAAATYAQARLAAGHAEGCVEALVSAGGGPALDRFDPGSRCDWWEVAVRGCVAVGDLARAADFVERSQRQAAGLPDLRAPTGFADLAAAEVALADGDLIGACVAADTARYLFERAGFRLDAARCALVGGEAHAAAGRRADSLERLEYADDVLAACGATQLQAQARVLMRRLGRRVPQPRQPESAGSLAAGPLAVLSRRERAVADLVAEGLSNRQIAADLVVSEKTVESHLSHIFTKLAVGSRAAVAALVGSNRDR